MTPLQEIFLARSRVLRVIYVVSLTHTNMESLVKDLGVYGVIQRGLTTTPSDQIELVCHFVYMHIRAYSCVCLCVYVRMYACIYV